MRRSNWHRGTVIAKAPTFRKGSGFRIQSNTVVPQGPPGISWLKNLGDLQGVTLSINSLHAGKSHIWGSAVLVAPGIAVTAAHVFEEIRDAGHLDGPDPVLFFHGCRHGATMNWAARSITVVGKTDLAIISLDLRSRLPKDRTINVVELTTRLPDIGEEVMAVGFRANSDAFANGPGYLEASGRMLRSVGRVLSVLLDGRDSAMAPYPCVEIEIAAPGGMSGGPVFDREGRVFGIVSTSLGDEAYAVASMVWPAFAVPFPTAWPKNLYRPTDTLLNVGVPGRGGFLRYPDRVQFVEGRNGEPGTLWRELIAPRF